MKKWEYWSINIDDYREEAKKGIEQIIRDVRSSQIWTESDPAEKGRRIQEVQRDIPKITEGDIKMYIANYWGELGWELTAIEGKDFIFKRSLEPEWEYLAGYVNKDFIKRCNLETKFNGNATDYDALFNELGEDGWELASCSVDSGGKFVVFKRKYVEDEEDFNDDGEDEFDEDEDGGDEVD
ncbi:MAG: hypothetical protein LBR23_05565 [Spirochaetaceae bacterium]|jgi:hypothetical protein|nr:hypothetical protein [Spirochaetaceae bacterium]